VKAEADAAKAAADAKKAAADAETAAIAAQVAAKNAKYPITGQTGAGAPTGAVTVETGGPKAEALLLATRAAQSAAKVVRADIVSVLGGDEAARKRSILVITNPDQLASPSANNYDVRRGVLLAQLKAAHRRFGQVRDANPPLPPASAASNGQGGGARIAAAPLLSAFSMADQILGSFSKVGSWFQSDYAFGQIAVDATNELYATAVVQSFLSSANPPKIIMTNRIVGPDVETLVTEMNDLQEAYGQAAEDHGRAVKSALDLRALATKDEKNAPLLLASAVQYEGFATATQKVLDSADAFVTALFAETPDKPALIVKIAQEREVKRRLAQDPLVLLISGKSVAAYYTRKNVWTFLGGPPLYTMGGANIEYALFEPGTGEVLAKGVAPVHGGYRSVGAVQRLFPAPGSGKSNATN